MLNQALDEIDVTTGMYLGEGRIPVAALAKAMGRPVTNNNIRISNSSVGVLNTGDLAKINAVVTITEGSDAEELGRSIRDFAQAVAESVELTRESKQEIGELLSALSEQVAGRRSRPVVGSLLKELGARVQSISALWAFCERIGKLLMDLGITG